jgi:protein-tyrosine kinase
MSTSNESVNNDVDNVSVQYTQTRVHKPHNQLLKENRVISIAQPGRWLESYRMLRTRCLQLMDGKGFRTLAVTSPNEQAGSSLLSVNLAISIAMELDRTALLVDANFKNPSVASLFGIHTDRGLSDYLLNDADLSSLFVNPGVDRLVVLPAGKPMLNSTEMLRSPKMVRLVNELKSRYPSRTIVFDMPAILAQDDTLGFAPYVDSVLLVVEQGKTKTAELQHAALLLNNAQKLLGTVLNKSMEQKIGFQL